METVEASTLVYQSPEEIYDFLVDFQQYEDYSKYVTNIDRDGADDAGAVYDITCSWWKIDYTAEVTVTDVDAPSRIDWEVSKDVDAHGHWEIEHVPEEAPDDEDDACRVHCFVEFDLESADAKALNLPGIIPIDKVIDKVKPKAATFGRIVATRMVADLEGEQRELDITVHETPATV
ncbi:SRPBCC family protein [Halocatena halophila]|uniref:SRPBCC family protein n=1 Tax=Halocatena halophila TaxID=2814576 RepID=UPI002ED5C56F